MLRGKALIGASAVILGIAAIPAVSDSAAGIAHHAQCPSKASNPSTPNRANGRARAKSLLPRSLSRSSGTRLTSSR